MNFHKQCSCTSFWFVALFYTAGVHTNEYHNVLKHIGEITECETGSTFFIYGQHEYVACDSGHYSFASLITNTNFYSSHQSLSIKSDRVLNSVSQKWQTVYYLLFPRGY